jgi:hypothetical protein
MQSKYIYASPDQGIVVDGSRRVEILYIHTATLLYSMCDVYYNIIEQNENGKRITLICSNQI